MFSPCTIVLHAGDAGGINFSAPEQIDTFVTITIRLNSIFCTDELERTTPDLIAHVPREEVVYFQTRDDPVAMEDISAQFPTVRALSPDAVFLSAVFPNSNPVGDGKIFLSLERLNKRHIIFINLLARRVLRRPTGHARDR